MQTLHLFIWSGALWPYRARFEGMGVALATLEEGDTREYIRVLQSVPLPDSQSRILEMCGTAVLADAVCLCRAEGDPDDGTAAANLLAALKRLPNLRWRT